MIYLQPRKLCNSVSLVILEKYFQKIKTLLGINPLGFEKLRLVGIHKQNCSAICEFICHSSQCNISIVNITCFAEMCLQLAHCAMHKPASAYCSILLLTVAEAKEVDFVQSRTMIRPLKSFYFNLIKHFFPDHHHPSTITEVKYQS